MVLKEFLSGFSYNSIAEWLATIDLHLLMKYKINGWPFSVSPLCRALGSCSHLFLLSHREIVGILKILPDCSNKNSSCSISPLFDLQEIHECSLMFSSGLGKRVQIMRHVADCWLRDQYTPDSFQLKISRSTLWGNYQDRIQDGQRNMRGTV